MSATPPGALPRMRVANVALALGAGGLAVSWIPVVNIAVMFLIAPASLVIGVVGVRATAGHPGTFRTKSVIAIALALVALLVAVVANTLLVSDIRTG